MAERLSKEELEKLKEELRKKLENSIREMTMKDMEKSKNKTNKLFAQWIQESLDEVERNYMRNRLEYAKRVRDGLKEVEKRVAETPKIIVEFKTQ